MEPRINQVKYILSDMGLNEYQSSALSHLLHLGESKASTLSKASGVPSARIYGVLEELSQKGLIIVKPGRPTLYSPMSPEEVSDALIADTRQEIRRRLTFIESYRDEFLTATKEIYLQGGTIKSRPPLLRIVSMGDVSLEETRKLFRSATSKIIILTRAMEYYSNVISELSDALSRNVSISILMRSKDSLDESDVKKRNDIVDKICKELGNTVEIKVSNEVPLRGCIIDPDNEGSALFLVEEKGVPLVFREAAITSHPGLVRGLTSMFELKWEHDSKPLDN
jgi:sugar-specific transcriptional regulator TrmB